MRFPCLVTRRSIAGAICLALLPALSAGCATDASRPALMSAASAEPATAVATETKAPDAPRVSCKCGPWAGAKGVPTECRKETLRRLAARKLQEQEQSAAPAEPTHQ